MLMGSIVASYWLTGSAPERAGNRGFVGSPGADTFPTADGWISTGANTLRQFQSMCDILACSEILTDQTFVQKLPQSPDGFLSNLSNDTLRARLVEAFSKDTAEEWERKLTAAGVPASKVHTLASYLDGHYQKTGRIDWRLDAHPQGEDKPARILNQGFRWTNRETIPTGRAPKLGEHTTELSGQK